MLLDQNDMPDLCTILVRVEAVLKMNLSFLSCAISHTALDAFVLAVVLPWLIFLCVDCRACSRPHSLSTLTLLGAPAAQNA